MDNLMLILGDRWVQAGVFGAGVYFYTSTNHIDAIHNPDGSPKSAFVTPASLAVAVAALSLLRPVAPKPPPVAMLGPPETMRAMSMSADDMSLDDLLPTGSFDA